ncbi:MAG: hypothetical protein LBT40_07920 [Deltaproteobacteria bacterium]|nr:hypothetical protein [Deltaproteobacteria bacterium]
MVEAANKTMEEAKVLKMLLAIFKSEGAEIMGLDSRGCPWLVRIQQVWAGNRKYIAWDIVF